MKHTPIFYVKRLETLQEPLPFEIRPLESPEEQGLYSGKPHSHRYFEIIWITKGRGSFSIDLQEQPFESDRIFCVRPGQVHRLQSTQQLEGAIISFHDSFLNMGEYEFDMTSRSSLFELFSGCHGISLDKDMADDAAALLQKMQKEFENDFPFRTQILKRFLKIFLIYLSRQFEAEFTMIRQDRETELVHGFISALEKQFREKKMVADYARMLFVTPNYLNEIVKKKTGYSASHYIRQRVVLEAKRMGHYSSSCMKEIAYSLGFLDSAHFSKFFKGAAGVNFSDFRREMLAVAV